MNYKLVKKNGFTLVGKSKIIQGKTAKIDCPIFWDEFWAKGYNKYINGRYGICFDDPDNRESFKYMIADNYNPAIEYPDFEFTYIEEQEWLVFTVIGSCPQKLQEMNYKIWKEFFPNEKFVLTNNIAIEYYTDPNKYEKGMKDDNYYCEIWVAATSK